MFFMLFNSVLMDIFTDIFAKIKIQFRWSYNFLTPILKKLDKN